MGIQPTRQMLIAGDKAFAIAAEALSVTPVHLRLRTGQRSLQLPCIKHENKSHGNVSCGCLYFAVYSFRMQRLRLAKYMSTSRSTSTIYLIQPIVRYGASPFYLTVCTHQQWLRQQATEYLTAHCTFWKVCKQRKRHGRFTIQKQVHFH